MTPKSRSEKLSKIKSIIKFIADSSGVHPSLVTKKEVLFTGEISDWEVRMLGGLELIKKNYFPAEEKDIVTISKMKNNVSYVNKLEQQLAEKLNVEEEIKQNLSKLVLPKQLTAVKTKKSRSKNLKRDMVVSLNDTHYGCLVSPEEVGHVNQYSWKEACRRTALMAKQVSEYKEDRRNEVDTLHVILNGDIISGVIHDVSGRTSDLLAIQQNGAIHILVHFLNYISYFYRNIKVYGMNGNHDDAVHRREGGRVLSHKYDGYTSPVFFALSSAFRNNKNISFNFTKSLSIDVNLPAGRMLVAHGDVLFSKQLGNPGTNINVKGLSDALNRFNTGEIAKGNKPIKMALFGHTHCHANFTTFDGIKVYIVPSLLGTDAYAYSLGINTNQAAQLIFESTKDFILGDSRLVDVTEADLDSNLDQIIPIYDRTLEWQK